MWRFDELNPMTEVVACCPEWATNDFVLLYVHEYLDGGEYATIWCPHCDGYQNVDLPFSAWTLEHERNERFRHEGEAAAIDEIIAEEKLIFPRDIHLIPDGYRVVESAYLEQMEGKLAAESKNIMMSEKELRYRCSVMLDVAALLAGCGDYDHKSKNETILRAISTLMQYHDPKTRFTRRIDDDEIPF